MPVWYSVATFICTANGGQLWNKHLAENVAVFQDSLIFAGVWLVRDGEQHSSHS